jgi:hypothetical protein
MYDLFISLFCQTIDALGYGMAKIADSMMKHILVPAISNIQVSVIEEGGPEHFVSVLSVVPSEEIKVSLSWCFLISKENCLSIHLF